MRLTIILLCWYAKGWVDRWVNNKRSNERLLAGMLLHALIVAIALTVLIESGLTAMKGGL